MNQRPESNEFPHYFANYIDLVPSGDLLSLLEQQLEDTITMVRSFPEVKGDFRYAPNKWSLKEIIGHMIDTERIMCYRTLHIARGDISPLPGFDQDAYVQACEFNRSSFQSLLDEFTAVRKATLALLRGFTEKAWLLRGTVNNNEITVGALGYVIAGHELHHRKVIQERYV